MGLIYGPSGCGKSSIVKAGLRPRLKGSSRASDGEASAEQTERTVDPVDLLIEAQDDGRTLNEGAYTVRVDVVVPGDATFSVFAGFTASFDGL